MCTATVTKSYLMKNGCISILATKLLNKIWLFLSFDYGEVVLHLYFGHRDIWWSMVTMYFSYEVWLQFTLVTKHGFSVLKFQS